MFKQQLVEAGCIELSPIFKQALKNKILKVPPGDEYSAGEALVFWTADWLAGLKLVSADQLRLLMEELGQKVREFGDGLGDKADKPNPPSAKIGFLDRRYVCLDQYDKFLDLQTGEQIQAADKWPMETIAYNLTLLFMRYRKAAMQAKPVNGLPADDKARLYMPGKERCQA